MTFKKHLRLTQYIFENFKVSPIKYRFGTLKMTLNFLSFNGFVQFNSSKINDIIALCNVEIPAHNQYRRQILCIKWRTSNLYCIVYVSYATFRYQLWIWVFSYVLTVIRSTNMHDYGATLFYYGYCPNRRSRTVFQL